MKIGVIWIIGSFVVKKRDPQMEGLYNMTFTAAHSPPPKWMLHVIRFCVTNAFYKCISVLRQGKMDIAVRINLMFMCNYSQTCAIKFMLTWIWLGWGLSQSRGGSWGEYTDVMPGNEAQVLPSTRMSHHVSNCDVYTADLRCLYSVSAAIFCPQMCLISSLIIKI
jgi:hypothetical protein